MEATEKSRVDILREGVEYTRQAKRAQERMDEWFFVQELRMREREAMVAHGDTVDTPLGQAHLLCRVARAMPLSLPFGALIAGSQDGAFSPSYALINPSFQVESFAGYCDPTVIYDDIAPDPERGLTAERIAIVRRYWENTPYVRRLRDVYAATGDETREVAYFVEPVTGHTVPDLRPALAEGVCALQERALARGDACGKAMAQALEAPLILARRYHRLALERLEQTVDPEEMIRLQGIIDHLSSVPAGGARTVGEAVQSFALLWQAMVLEQAPNPYALSVGNLDRVLAPYFHPDGDDRDEAVQMVRALLCFFQVGARCWAISQNVMVGGRAAGGADLSGPTTDIVLDAFFATNDPQPALSVKVHAATPEALYRRLGAFFFTPGHSTPSLFNDDALLANLRHQGVAEADVADYGIAGCQEPLIMGKASLNTTNTWLNLAKILELTLNDGRSLITDRPIGPSWQDLGLAGGATEVYQNLEAVFLQTLDSLTPAMARAGNACVTILGEELPVPLTSALMDSLDSGRDLRDPRQPGTRYAASGCLIHGLSVVADSLHAVERALATGHWTADQIRQALRDDFDGHDALLAFLKGQEKYGADAETVDAVAVRLVHAVSDRVAALRNPAGRPFLADWSTPSTHLLYGYWVGATPDGRRARRMLGYGVDPRPEHAPREWADRLLTAWKLPYEKMTGGYASHLGIHPVLADGAASVGEKGLWMRDHVIAPLFRLGQGEATAPYYVYFNIDSADHLRDVLKFPRRYAPSGVYILRIHGTFVNFLDLSPAIQEDIIVRLEGAGRAG